MTAPANDRRVAVLRAFEDAINRGDAEAAAALFAPGGSLTEEGVRYASVHDALAYLAGAETRLTLGDFTAIADGIACTYHDANALDRAIGYAGNTRQARVTFAEHEAHVQIATLVILPQLLEARQQALLRIEPFFDWLKAEHPTEWASMSALSYESGALLARMARQWAHERAGGSA